MEIKITSETTSNKVFRVATAVNRLKRCQELGQIFPDHLSVWFSMSTLSSSPTTVEQSQNIWLDTEKTQEQLLFQKRHRNG